MKWITWPVFFSDQSLKLSTEGLASQCVQLKYQQLTVVNVTQSYQIDQLGRSWQLPGRDLSQRKLSSNLFELVHVFLLCKYGQILKNTALFARIHIVGDKVLCQTQKLNLNQKISAIFISFQNIKDILIKLRTVSLWKTIAWNREIIR